MDGGNEGRVRVTYGSKRWMEGMRGGLGSHTDLRKGGRCRKGAKGMDGGRKEGMEG